MIYDRIRKFQKDAFVLIEIVLVVVIISIFIFKPEWFGICVTRSKDRRIFVAKVCMNNINHALNYYQLDNGGYPTTKQGLNVLITRPSSSVDISKWQGPYLERIQLLKDPWGKHYVYSSPGVHNPHGYDLLSYGPDGVKSSDDITNWESQINRRGERPDQQK